MDEIKLILPFPPSNNQYYRYVGPGKTTISERGRKYKQSVVEHLERTGKAGLLINYPVVLRIELHLPDERRRDVDNYDKGLLDSLTNAKFWADDELVQEYTVRKMPPVPKGFVVVRVTPDMQSGFE